MSLVKGVTLKYRKRDRAMVVRVSPDVPFMPYSVWIFSENLRNGRRPVHADIVIEDNMLVMELVNYGPADDDLVALINMTFSSVAETPKFVRPVTVFRRTIDAGLNPFAPVTVNDINQFMTETGQKYGIDQSWRGRLNDQGYLCVSFDATVAATRLTELYQPVFEGACSLSAREYNAQAGTLVFRLEYDHRTQVLNFPRANSYGFEGIQVVTGNPNCILGIAVREYDDMITDAITKNTLRGILFAQALGCHPVGEFTLNHSPYIRTVRVYGPLGVNLPSLQ